MKNIKKSIMLNAFISTAAISVSGISALFIVQNPQMLKYCYPALAAIFSISSLGLAASLSNLIKNISKHPEQTKEDREVIQKNIEPEIHKETENVKNEENTSVLDSNFINTWKTSSPEEKRDFVSKNFFSASPQTKSKQLVHKSK